MWRQCDVFSKDYKENPYWSRNETSGWQRSGRGFPWVLLMGAGCLSVTEPLSHSGFLHWILGWFISCYAMGLNHTTHARKKWLKVIYRSKNIVICQGFFWSKKETADIIVTAYHSIHFPFLQWRKSLLDEVLMNHISWHFICHNNGPQSKYNNSYFCVRCLNTTEWKFTHKMNTGIAIFASLVLF